MYVAYREEHTRDPLITAQTPTQQKPSKLKAQKPDRQRHRRPKVQKPRKQSRNATVTKHRTHTRPRDTCTPTTCNGLPREESLPGNSRVYLGFAGHAWVTCVCA